MVYLLASIPLASLVDVLTLLPEWLRVKAVTASTAVQVSWLISLLTVTLPLWGTMKF